MAKALARPSLTNLPSPMSLSPTQFKLEEAEKPRAERLTGGSAEDSTGGLIQPLIEHGLQTSGRTLKQIFTEV